jgi:hypothetical protein
VSRYTLAHFEFAGIDLRWVRFHSDARAGIDDFRVQLSYSHGKSPSAKFRFGIQLKRGRAVRRRLRERKIFSYRGEEVARILDPIPVQIKSGGKFVTKTEQTELRVRGEQAPSSEMRETDQAPGLGVLRLISRERPFTAEMQTESSLSILTVNSFFQFA